ncbi:hypothetical protein YB2330_001435 [Saitoella coloradoensis]
MGASVKVANKARSKKGNGGQQPKKKQPIQNQNQDAVVQKPAVKKVKTAKSIAKDERRAQNKAGTRVIHVPTANGNDDSDLSDAEMEGFDSHFKGFTVDANAIAKKAPKPKYERDASQKPKQKRKAVDMSDDEEDWNESDEDQRDWEEEQDYELRPRVMKTVQESTRLPIKTKEGRLIKIAAPMPTKEESESEEEKEEATSEPESVVEAKPEKKLTLKQRVLAAKEELAKLANDLIEDPEENIFNLKRLRELSESPDLPIVKLALVTQLAVYKDIIPGYRIRPLTEIELAQKVGKDVKKLRVHEETLVGNYQAYVQLLGTTVKDQRQYEAGSQYASLALIACNAVCTLLTTHPHFNFRTELLNIVIGRLSRKTVDEGFEKCRLAIEQTFREDDEGHASMEAVKLLAKMMQSRHYKVDEGVLNTFFHLRLLSEFNQRASTERVEKEQQVRMKKKDREHRTKKQRKQAKEDKEIEKEMKEAEAIVDKEEKDRMQGETLKIVFVTYIRILKEGSKELMGATLEGLAKFAHLINIDFFGDLLEALKELLALAEANDDGDDRNDYLGRSETREALLCVTTAFALLSGQGDTHASLDLSTFVHHLYSTLLQVSLNPDVEFSSKTPRLQDPSNPQELRPSRVNVATEMEMVVRSLESILFKQRNVPPVRVAALAKRLGVAMLNFPEKSTLASLGTMHKMARKYSRLQALFSTEDRTGNGVYNAFVDDPELSNPYAATMWETVLLERHYSPKVADAAKTLYKAFDLQ